MEYLENVPEGISRILCCECGTAIEPNPSNMCVACLRGQVDITEGIPKQGTLYFCRGCERYLQPPAEWIPCTLESRELLSLCLKKLKGLSRVKLVDAGFVWTEPHSKRIKVKLTVHGEVLGGATLQQVFVVEFTVNHHMCDDCHRTEAQDYWRAVVQVRQKAENKKTFFYLEQLILKHRAHENTLGIKPIHDGLDFFYSTEGYARKMIDFLVSVLPVKYQHSKKLISHDIHSNTYNYKFTYSVDIVPISKDSVVCLPKKLTHQLGGIAPICLVYRVTNSLHLIDPMSGQMGPCCSHQLGVKRRDRIRSFKLNFYKAVLLMCKYILAYRVTDVSSTVFWRYQFDCICNPKQLTEYIVMDIEPIAEKHRKTFPGQGTVSAKHLLSDVWLVKASELGLTENNIHTRTHLGHILKPGDSVLGYNLVDSNANDPNFDKLDPSVIPDVILVKKYYADRLARRRARAWKLKHLAQEDTALDIGNNDYNDFLDDLEEDPAYRQNVNIFRDATIPVDTDDMEDPTEPRITLEEMLDDLDIQDVDMGGEEE